MGGVVVNLADVMALHARHRPQLPAIEGPGDGAGTEVLDYAGLEARLSRLAGGLAALGVRPGDIVGVGLGERVSHAVALLAVARLGGIVLPLDHRWSVEETRRVLERFAVRAALLEPEGVAALAPFRGSLPELGDRVVSAGAVEGAVPLDEAMRGEPLAPGASAPGGRPWADAPLFIALTSGTTGAAKGAVLTHGQMLMRLVSQWAHLGFSQEDRYLCVTPLYHGAGRAFTLSHLYLGARVVIGAPPFDAAGVLEAIARHRITTLFLVPTMLQRLLEVPGLERYDRSSLRVVLSSGAALSPELRAEVQQRFAHCLYDYYGSTDGGGISVLGPEEHEAHGASVGRAMLHTDIRIVDAQGRALPPGEEGEVCFRGPGVCGGYHRNLEADAETFRDGWFYPGDLGWMDAEGYLHISGRLKEIIIRGGVNLYPAEIEAALAAHPAVREVAVIGVPSTELGEEAVAFLVPREDAGGDAGDDPLRDFAARRLAPYKIPARFLWVDSLPRNVGGKVEREKLRARALGILN